MRYEEPGTWVAQKRVANTDSWGTVGVFQTKDEAKKFCLEDLDGARSTGARIFEVGRFEWAELVCGQ